MLPHGKTTIQSDAEIAQPAFACSKLTIETLDVKYVQR